MLQTKADFTNTFRDLGKASSAGLSQDPVYLDWHRRWQDRLGRQPQAQQEVLERMQRCNPAFVPRNHKVEEALAAAVDQSDLDVLRQLLGVLANPFDYSQDHPEFAMPSCSDGYQTFCGT
jgi:uncharacterized protein YdiU (UPF0061 family)